MKRMELLVVAMLSITSLVHAGITRHAGSNDALPHDKYIHVVSEAQSPVTRTWIKAKDGVYIAAAIGVAFGFFPALQASRLNPIDALRTE